MNALKDIASTAILDIRSAIEEGLKERGKVASGRTINSIQTGVFSGDGFAVGALTADSQWKFVGNGRGPGRLPPVEPIRAWIEARGLELSPYAVAKKIAEQGSLDHRKGNPNVFLHEIDGWEKDKLPKVMEEVGEHGADRLVELVKTELKKPLESNG